MKLIKAPQTVLVAQIG